MPANRRRLAPACAPLESRDSPAGLGAAALALSASPAVSAARTAMLAYQAGQLAYTGHTSLLLGTVQVSQPYPLKSLLGRHRPAPHWPQIPAVRGPSFGWERPGHREADADHHGDHRHGDHHPPHGERE